MNWFLIALGAPVLWALVNISDQYLIAKYSKSEQGSGALVLFSSLIGIITAFLIAVFIPNVFQVPLGDRLLLAFTGVLTIGWVILYFRALSVEDVSAVVPWFLTIPIFGYILGYVFLGETLTPYQLIGSIIVMIGAVILSIDFSGSQKNIFKWKVLKYMIPACLMASVIGVIFKYVTVVDNFWVSSFWEYIGLGITGVVIYFGVKTYRKDFLEMLRNGGRIIISLNISSETFTVIGNLLTNYAVLLAPVAIVYLVASFQPAVVLILTLLGTRFFPHIVTEDTSFRTLLPKVVAILFMVLGSTVLFL